MDTKKDNPPFVFGMLVVTLVIAAPFGALGQGGNSAQDQIQDKAARTAGAENARFEVASIKPAPFPSDGRYLISADFRPNGFDGAYMTIKQYIQIAYDIPNWDWIIGPSWLNAGSPTFSIRANASGPTPKRTLRTMLRRLLEDRFGLRTHTEDRELPIYALTVMKGGIRLKPVQYDGSDADNCVRPSSTGLHATQCAMSAFAGFFGSFINLGRPVIDMTGLSDRYDFELRYITKGLAPVTDPEFGAPGQTIFEALEEIGLKLEPRRGPVQVLVVDHVSQTPVEE